MRRFTKPILIALASLALVALFAAEAHAGSGVVIDSSRLPAKARARLDAQIAKARASQPAAFAAVAKAPAMAAAADAKKRGRRGSIARQLKALGKPALLPMLEMVAVAGPERGARTEAAWQTLQVGLLEAIGKLRDERAVPVLMAILDKRGADYEIDRAAAQALAKLGTDAAATKLVTLARTKGDKQLAVLAAMGDCRRTVVAETLAELVGKRPDADTARVIARSLGAVGNSWAWSMPSVAATGEGPDTRATAAEALMATFIAYDGHTRRVAAKAILLVDDSATPALIAKARQGADAELSAALDKLAEWLARNPIRR